LTNVVAGGTVSILQLCSDKLRFENYDVQIGSLALPTLGNVGPGDVTSPVLDLPVGGEWGVL
jgi:hypothetical protein